MKQVFLKKDKDAAVRRRHPWVFSGAIARTTGSPKDGDFVQVLSHAEEVLGAGFMSSQSIAVKMMGFGSSEGSTSIEDLLKKRLEEAIELRQRLGLFTTEGTTAHRLSHGEGDSLPGLIIDRYGSTAVIQCHSLGMYLVREKIASLLTSILPGTISTVFDKSSDTLSSMKVQDSYLSGNSAACATIKENGLSFTVNWEEGQKTGFFLDQRDNRKLISSLAKDKKVLNTFAYTGGFSVYAVAGGATHVVSADISDTACTLCEGNVRLNFPDAPHTTIKADCLDYLAKMSDPYDMIILDPPAFAKHRDGIKGALRGYRGINRSAFQKITPSGIVATFSCSQLISQSDFESVVMSAAVEAGRPVKILYRLSQAPCHPISLFHPEGSYLKGLILEVL